MVAGAADAAERTAATPRVDAVAALVATGLGAGYAPVAPGTAGSLVGLALYWPLSHLGAGAQLAALAVLFTVGVLSSTRLARNVGRKDPGLVVVDEIAGMWTSLIFVPFNPLTALLAFLAFRAMDVTKPWPARQLEALPGGWGIMCDDMMAGVYANLLVHLALRAWA
jgi:phosphatidylglycerophosphatase A